MVSQTLLAWRSQDHYIITLNHCVAHAQYQTELTSGMYHTFLWNDIHGLPETAIESHPSDLNYSTVQAY